MSAPSREEAGAAGLHVVSRPPKSGGEAKGRVVLVHGAMDRATSFGRLANRLADLEVVSYDRRGYAASAAVGPSEDFADQVADLLSALDGRPAVALGHSFGGNIVLTAAQHHPELIPAAVVFEPPAPWHPWWPGNTRRSSGSQTPEDAAEAFMRRMVGNRIWEHLPARTREMRRSEGAALLAEIAAVGTRRPYDPAQVKIPVIVGWGAASASHLSHAARLLVTELPDACGVEVPGSNHGVHLSHPAELAAMARDALVAAG